MQPVDAWVIQRIMTFIWESLKSLKRFLNFCIFTVVPKPLASLGLKGVFEMLMDWLCHSYLFVSLVLFGKAGAGVAAALCWKPPWGTYGWRLCLLLLLCLHRGIAHWHKDFTAACKICLNIPELKMCYNVQWHSKLHCNIWRATAAVLFPFLAVLSQKSCQHHWQARSWPAVGPSWSRLELTLMWGKLLAPFYTSHPCSLSLSPSQTCPRTTVLCACTAGSTAAAQGFQAQSSTHMKQRPKSRKKLQSAVFYGVQGQLKSGSSVGIRAPVVSLCCKNGGQTPTQNSPQMLWQGFHD